MYTYTQQEVDHIAETMVMFTNIKEMMDNYHPSRILSDGVNVQEMKSCLTNLANMMKKKENPKKEVKENPMKRVKQDVDGSENIDNIKRRRVEKRVEKFLIEKIDKNGYFCLKFTGNHECVAGCKKNITKGLYVLKICDNEFIKSLNGASRELENNGYKPLSDGVIVHGYIKAKNEKAELLIGKEYKITFTGIIIYPAADDDPYTNYSYIQFHF